MKNGFLVAVLYGTLTACSSPPAHQTTPANAGAGAGKELCSSDGQRYIAKGEWIYRYQEWTLSLTPTECGRNIQSDKTGNMFYEIVKDYSGSRFWTNDRGMINQLTCHLTIARNKPEWNLDPWRPYVGHTETVAQQCNVTVPAPDQPFH
jgi:hypothetical protein